MLNITKFIIKKSVFSMNLWCDVMIQANVSRWNAKHDCGRNTRSVSALHCITLHCIALHYITLDCIALHRIQWWSWTLKLNRTQRAPTITSRSTFASMECRLSFATNFSTHRLTSVELTCLVHSGWVTLLILFMFVTCTCHNWFSKN